MKIQSLLIACLAFSGLAQGEIVQTEQASYSLAAGFGSLYRSDTQGKNALLAVIAPDVKNLHWGLVAVKSWGGQPNRYIATACGYAAPLNNHSEYYDDCGGYSRRNTATHIIVAVLEKTENGWEAVATPYQETFSSDPNVSISKNSAFSLNCIGCRDDNFILGTLSSLDFGSYQLNANTPAFGVRFGTNESYVGGSAFAESITLFAILNNKVKPVFKHKISYYAEIASNWNADGSRQQDITESDSRIIFSKKQTHGFNNLILETDDQKTKSVFVWNVEQQQYQRLK